MRGGREWRVGGRERGREGWMVRGSEGRERVEGGWEGGEGGWEGGRVGGREGGRDGGREGGMEEGLLKTRIFDITIASLLTRY